MTATPDGITFLSSTTTTRTTRAGGDEETTVGHVARFAVNPGAITDQVHQYGKQVFRPLFMVVTWENGLLVKVRLTGRRVLKSGKLQEHSEQNPNADISRETIWDTFGGNELDRSRLPEPIPERLAAYELAVSTMTGRS